MAIIGGKFGEKLSGKSYIWKNACYSEKYSDGEALG